MPLAEKEVLAYRFKVNPTADKPRQGKTMGKKRVKWWMIT
jgi:hypothetical protein